MIHSNSKARESEKKSYLSNYKDNQDHLIKYIQSRKKISRQQFFLHNLVRDLDFDSSQGVRLGDFGCGGGWQTYHLAKNFNILSADLYDIHHKSLELAEENLHIFNMHLNFYHEDIVNPVYLQENQYDLGINLMTLSWVDYPSIFLENMLKSIKPKGFLILSTLINRNHPDIDLDIIQKDNKLRLNKKCTVFGRNTFMNFMRTFKIKNVTEFYDFNIDVDLPIPEEKGTGTYTVKLENGTNLEVSGGAIFPWSFIVIQKC